MNLHYPVAFVGRYIKDIATGYVKITQTVWTPDDLNTQPGGPSSNLVVPSNSPQWAGKKLHPDLCFLHQKKREPRKRKNALSKESKKDLLPSDPLIRCRSCKHPCRICIWCIRRAMEATSTWHEVTVQRCHPYLRCSNGGVSGWPVPRKNGSSVMGNYRNWKRDGTVPTYGLIRTLY